MSRLPKNDCGGLDYERYDCEDEGGAIMKTGEKIRTARKDADLSIGELAKKSGVAVNSIQRYETGVRQPSLSQLQLLAGAFGVSASYLMGSDYTDKSDVVNHPAHYKDGKIEVTDFIEDKKFGFNLGNAVKYICRAGKKDPGTFVEDLRKAVWYIDREIQRAEGG